MESKRRGREKKGSKKCKSEKRWRAGEWQNWGKEEGTFAIPLFISS